MSDIRVYGIEEVVRLFEEVDKAPARVLTQAVKKSAKIALNYAKSHVYTGGFSPNGQPYGRYKHPPGNLKKMLKLKSEKRKKGKRVYQLSSDWYAHFIDYGFTDRGGTFHQGNRFLRNSIDINRDAINQNILNELGNELDKLR